MITDPSKGEDAYPGFAALADGWSRTRLVPVAALDPRLEALARTLRANNNMSGVLLAQFEIHPDPELADYFARNRIGPDFFRHFFGHPDALAVLGLPPERDELGFSRMTGAQALESLVHTIMLGGAYHPYTGSERDARKLANQFAAAIGERFASAGAWLSTDPWARWFRAVAWDNSFFWFDRGTGIATVLLMTDTD